MKKLKNNIYFQVILALFLIVLGWFILWNIYPGEIVQIYGNRSFEGAEVYVNDKHVAVMAWDEKNDRTYAKDLRFIGQYSFSLGLEELNIRRDSLKFKDRFEEYELKIVTNDNKVHIMKLNNIEDLTYAHYYLKDFELVKE